MKVDDKHDVAVELSRSSSTDSLGSQPLDDISIRVALPVAMSLGDLARLPMEIIYYMFGVMDPYTAIGFALTNKTNLSIYTQWLDTASSLQACCGVPSIHEMFDYVRKRICKTATSKQRRDAAAALRLWQRKVLQNRLPTKKWNVCNGCLEFKQDHCTVCIDGVCGTFVCHPYCLVDL